MKQITDIDSDPRQRFQTQIDGGTLATFEFWFSDVNIGWYFTVSYEDFASSNLRLVTSPNCLNTYRNLIPFGLACVTDDGYEPWFLDDFVNGRVRVYILNQDEVLEVQEQLFTE